MFHKFIVSGPPCSNKLANAEGVVSSIGRLHRKQRDAAKGFKMDSKSHREDSRWRLSPLGRIQDGGGDVIEDDIIQDGGLIYS